MYSAQVRSLLVFDDEHIPLRDGSTAILNNQKSKHKERTVQRLLSSKSNHHYLLIAVNMFAIAVPSFMAPTLVSWFKDNDFLNDDCLLEDLDGAYSSASTTYCRCCTGGGVGGGVTGM